MTDSVADQAVRAIAMVQAMDDDMSNDDPDRHIIRNLRRVAYKALENGFSQAIELAYQAKDVRKTFAELKESNNG